MSVRALLESATRRLGGSGARLDVEVLLAHALGVTRASLYAWPEREPDVAARARFERMLEARERGEPVAYLVGHREFFSIDLVVSRDVLIPRPETELLVELALERIPRGHPARVADLGTGSGAIALAIANERPDARVVATDASEAALAVASSNAERLGLRNVTFVQSDWLDALADERFDLVVSNPPYVAAGDAHLARGDLPYEPLAALVSGADGLDAIRRIVAQAGGVLPAEGWLLLEHGWDQAPRVRALFESSGYGEVMTARDAAGHERVTIGARRA